MPDPGEVFYLPRDWNEPLSKGDRPHVLLSLCPPGSETVTFAYGSTKGNDAARGAEHVLVDPFASPYRATGLIRPTYGYTSRLVGRAAGDLGSPAGRIIEELPQIRASLVRALGFGTGVTRESNRAGSSRRGRVVQLSPTLAAEWDVDHAVVLTEPSYSRFGYQQTVVPLLGGTFESSPLDVEIHDTNWLNALKERYRIARVAVPMIATVYQPVYIARFVNAVVPAEVMTRAERALAAHFGLGGIP